jgi:type I restriction enzyme M protein
MSMPGNHTDIEKRLWDSADQLRANSGLKSSEYSMPVLGLIFLRFAESRFDEAAKAIKVDAGGGRRRRAIGKADYQAKGVLYVPEEARYSRLLRLPEGQNIGRAINEAMRAIEAENEDLKGVLPKEYNRLDNDALFALLKTFSQVALDFDGDIFGRIYEYFLGKFALAEGQKGGEFYTPASIVKLIVEVIEPFHGRIYDPACGSGGMFVQSANFVKRHRENPSTQISIYGQEKVAETIKLCRLNLAVHGLSGDIKQANAYYEDAHKSVGTFDFVMANPPFNVDGVDKEKIKEDLRYPYGIPKVDNANYLWIQIFWSALNDKGRAGFIMANPASDARQSELEIRKHLVEERGIDVMVAIGPKFFYNVILPCSLWFFDKGKKKTDRKDNVLFIDARHIYKQIDRAHREFSPDQIQFIANIVRLYRHERLDGDATVTKMLKDKFPRHVYRDVPGLCRVASIEDIRRQSYSLNPGRYVGVGERHAEEFDFMEKLLELNDGLRRLNAEARELETQIDVNLTNLIAQNESE